MSSATLPRKTALELARLADIADAAAAAAAFAAEAHEELVEELGEGFDGRLRAATECGFADGWEAFVIDMQAAAHELRAEASLVEPTPSFRAAFAALRATRTA
jgi:hypothetical protein